LASRYHWTQLGLDTPWTGNFSDSRTTVIPAGGRIEKLLIAGSTCNGSLTGIGVTVPVELETFATVTLSGADFTPSRIIYSHRRRVPLDLVGLYDVATAQRVYSCWWEGGDNELGTNLKCSYGGPGHAAITVQYQYGVREPTVKVHAATGRLFVPLKILYWQ
jgi:hypothetical protein